MLILVLLRFDLVERVKDLILEYEDLSLKLLNVGASSFLADGNTLEFENLLSKRDDFLILPCDDPVQFRHLPLQFEYLIVGDGRMSDRRVGIDVEAQFFGNLLMNEIDIGISLDEPTNLLIQLFRPRSFLL